LLWLGVPVSRKGSRFGALGGLGMVVRAGLMIVLSRPAGEA